MIYDPPAIDSFHAAPPMLRRVANWIRNKGYWARANPLLALVSSVVIVAATLSMTIVAKAISKLHALPPRWDLQVAVFVATALVPQFVIELVAIVAERLAPQIPNNLSTRWFRNTGAFVGLIERPLLLGSLVAARPEFVGVWLVFKGLAGYRAGLTESEFKERRLFQLFLLNNAMSLGGVALGWLLWLLLALPRFK